jgi:FkbM family methyltransferase
MTYFRLKKTILYYLRRIFRDKQIYQQDLLKYVHGRGKNLNILEAGAADGYDTLRFAKLFPKSTVYAFEPVAKNFEKLKNTVSKCRNVRIFNMGLSDFDGVMEINVSKYTDNSSDIAVSSSFLMPELHTSLYPNIDFVEKEKVTVKTIDTWAQEENISRIDVMWLDLQGYEYRVLKASPNILKSVNAIYSEVSYKEVFKDGPLYEDYKSWLNSQGFEVVMEEVVDEGTGNVIFARKEGDNN